eukprot:SAG11_NODE_75_length_18024_cov_5.885356_14_plen_121_part_00
MNGVPTYAEDEEWKKFLDREPHTKASKGVSVAAQRNDTCISLQFCCSVTSVTSVRNILLHALNLLLCLCRRYDITTMQSKKKRKSLSKTTLAARTMIISDSSPGDDKVLLLEFRQFVALS